MSEIQITPHGLWSANMSNIIVNDPSINAVTTVTSDLDDQLSDALKAEANGSATSAQTALTTNASAAVKSLHSATLVQQQEATIEFESGLNASGKPVATDYWNMSGGTVSAAKWGSAVAGTSGGQVTYYIDSSWTTIQQTSIKAAFALWSAEANINFVQTTSATNANIKVYNKPGTGSSATSITYTGGGNGIATLAPGITINIDASSFGSPASYVSMNGYGVETIVHEIGHSLGLGHSGPYNGTVVSSTQQYGAYDTRAYSVMSYINPSDTFAGFYSQEPTRTQWIAYTPSTTMQDDIISAQRLYGVKTNGPLSGNNTFGFNCNIGSGLNFFFDFSINTHPIVTLYDTGINNTLNTSGFKGVTQTINLNSGTFSSIGGLTNNVCIASGTVINTAMGDGDNNTFVLNTGSDTINGESGPNTVVMPYAESTYKFSLQGATITATGDGAIDRLTNVTQINFSGGVSLSTATLLNPKLISVSPSVTAVTKSSETAPIINISGTQSSATVSIAGNQITISDQNGSSVLSVVANTPTILSFADSTGVADTSGNAGDVARLYQAVFNHPSDDAGLAYWTGQIDSGTLGLQDVVNGFLASPEGLATVSQNTSSFVSAIYQNALGHTPDANGLTYWADTLNSGSLTKAALVVNIAESAESQSTTMQTDGSAAGSEIYRLYETIMGRAPDSNGLTYWMNSLFSGTSETQIASYITASSEFISNNLSDTAYINQLYTQGLGRNVDASGLAYWTQTLSSGATRATVAIGFANSTEAQTLYASATHNNWVKTS
jgi:Domain of unknown function (DUF4214)/Peptidase M10 serralysin C terminal/Matrixin